MFKNIIVGGGNTRIPGFKNRLQSELDNNGYLPDGEQNASVTEMEHDGQVCAAWKGLKQFAAQSDLLNEYQLSKAEYQEHGSRILKKFYL